MFYLDGTNFMTKNILISFLILSSCASVDTESPYTEVFRGIGSYLLDRKQDVSDEFVDSFPYSFAIVSIGRSPEYRLVLVNIVNDTYEWISADYVRIFTKKGRIVKTIGLQHDVEFKKYSDISNNLPLTVNSLIVDYIEPQLYNVILEVKYKHQNNIVMEEFSSSILNWNGLNLYKISDSGDVIETEQSIHPFVPKIKMKFYLKKNSAK